MGEVIEVDPVTGRVVEGRGDRWVRVAVRAAVWFAVVGVAGYVTAWVCGPLAITSAPAGLVVAVAAVGVLVAVWAASRTVAPLAAVLDSRIGGCALGS